MEKTKYDCVIFDFFGTLVPNFTMSAHKTTLGEIARRVCVPADLFIERWLQAFRERVTGEWPDTYSAILNICNEVGVCPENGQIESAVKIRIEFTRNNIHPREDAINTLSQIKKLGLKLGLISDCSPELPDLWDKTEFSPYFDATVFSCEQGTKKPDPLMYKTACDLLNVAPEKCLYIGDGGSRELTGACNAGMYPVLLYDHNEQGTSDANRMEGEEWHGPRINTLSEVLGLLYDN
jgi:putative hydrolase of the HAD superfamily